MDCITVVLVGASGYGLNYFSRIEKLRADYPVKLVGIVDIAYEKCLMYEELKSQNIPFYRTLKDFYNNNRADLAIIAAPIHFHKELSILALRNSSFVLCEKPVAGCYTDALEMKKAAEEYSKFLIIGYQWSFYPSIIELKKDILSGLFGKPISAKSIVLWPRTLDYFSRSWAGTDYIDGRCVMDSVANNATAHYIHNMLFLFGGSMNNAADATLKNSVLYRANDIKTFDAYQLEFSTADGINMLAYGAHCVDKLLNPILKIVFENAKVELNLNSNRMTAVFSDGTIKEYDAPNNETSDTSVLSAALKAISSSDYSGIVCDINTAIKHTKLMDEVNAGIKHALIFSENEISRISKKDTSLVAVNGLAERFISNFENEIIQP